MKLLDKVRETIERYGLIEAGDKIVAGVSGGADSVALLYLLNSLKKELDIYIHVAHLDHMLRFDSYKDKEFVENLALRLDLAITTSRVNVKGLAKTGSLEEIARNARLGFLFKVAKDIKANKIALGHNLDDQAETVLMRILRGTGLYGLSGILPKRNIAGFYIIRPLIEARRKDIENFLKKKNIKPRMDKTNLEEIYFRNKVRHKLLPLLAKEYNKNIKEILSNMAENVGYDYEYLNLVAERKMKQLGSKMKPKVQGSCRRNTKAAIIYPYPKRSGFRPRSINIEKFLKLHPSIQRLVLRLNIAAVKGDMRRITFQHIKEIEDLISSRPINSIVDLPKGVSVIKKKKILSIYRRT